MAKQIGDIIIVGTIDDITFYKMEGRGYARKKTSLTGKKVKKDPRFKRTMESAHRLGRGSQLASTVYRSLPKEKQVYALFKELKSIAVLAIKEGKSEEEVLGLLQQRVGKHRQKKHSTAASHTHAVQSKLPRLRRCPRLYTVYGGGRKEAGSDKKASAERRRSQRWVERCRKRRPRPVQRDV